MAHSSMNDDALREQLAAIEHERWAHWQRYLHSRCVRNPDGSLTIPADLVERWESQIATPYEELTEAEKESDRSEVARYWPLVESYALNDQTAKAQLSSYGAEIEEWKVRTIVASNPGIDEAEVRRSRAQQRDQVGPHPA